MLERNGSARSSLVGIGARVGHGDDASRVELLGTQGLGQLYSTVRMRSGGGVRGGGGLP